MKFNKTVRVIVLMTIVFVALLAVGTVLSQGPDGDNGYPPAEATSAAEPSGMDNGSEGLIQDDDSRDPEEIHLAQPPPTMNYQGYLTDSNGDPLNGMYDMVFQLYDDEFAGSVEWGPETHIDVPVSDGLFQVALGITVIMHPSDFDEALFLAVEVEGTMLSPRQPLRTVPYAFGLVPGAEVEGDPDLTNYGLRVDNTGENPTDRGIYARGEQYGLYAEEVGVGSDIGIYSPDYVQAKGFRSNDDSYIWVPGTAGMLAPSAGCTLYPQSHGSVRLECSTSGTKSIYIPVTVPGILLGQQVRVESLLVFYDLDNTGSYINTTYLNKLTGAGSSDALIINTTNRTSTTPTSYSLSTTGSYTLTATSGPLNVYLAIFHDGDVNHDVNIGGVRVRLGHTE